MLSATQKGMAVNYQLYSNNSENDINDSLWISAQQPFSTFKHHLNNKQFKPADQTHRYFAHQQNKHHDTSLPLDNPLWMAAKYGGFVDLDQDGTPLNETGDHREWDSKSNVDGSYGSDGLPDNYYFVHNPQLLERNLHRVLNTISHKRTTASHAAVAVSNTEGQSAVYQALFQPSINHAEKSIQWGGILQALFIDKQGMIREDSNNNAQLDTDDYAIDMQLDAQTGEMLFNRFTVNEQGQLEPTSYPPQPISQLKTIWNARDQLAAVQQPKNNAIMPPPMVNDIFSLASTDSHWILLVPN